jgi:MscS family membrane protein
VSLARLTSVLFQPGPADLLGWQWLALPALLLIAWALGVLLTRLTRALLRRITSRTMTRWDDALLERIAGPLTLIWAMALSYLALPSLRLHPEVLVLLHRWFKAGLLVVFFWSMARSVDVAREMLGQSSWMRNRPTRHSLLQLGARIGKVCLLCVALVTLLSELGYPVASLVAGLGIGGLAVALAAQKTLENLFGAVAIGADQPFREGDLVRADDVLGTVEAIGLRSTRFRTADRTLVTIPNGKLAEMRLESYSARDRLRFSCVLRLVYGTSPAQLRGVLDGCERVLRAEPKLWPDGVSLRLVELAESSLNVEVSAWFQIANADEFAIVREKLLMAFIDAVTQAGSAFAFPTRTLHLSSKGVQDSA